MSQKTEGSEPYRVERRTKHKTADKELSGYAIDITIRVNGEGAYFLQDHNSDRNVMPHGTSREDLLQTIEQALVDNYEEHFGPS